jgi:HEAT repeat protein
MMSNCFCFSKWLWGGAGVVLGLVFAAPAGAVDPVIDALRYTNPDVPMPRRVKVFPDGLLPLWLKALERPEADLQRSAATAIVRAQARGMSGLETAVPSLRRLLGRDDLHATVRLAVAQALVALDARAAADRLFALAQAGDAKLCTIIGPALARWDYAPARAVWLQRLDEPTAPVNRRVLAVEALAMVREPKAIPKLREMVFDAGADPVVRLESARALGTIRTTGAENDANRLEGDAHGAQPRLLAALLLRQHQSAEALRILERLALDAEPTVASVALERLVETEPLRVIALREKLLTNRDANVRGHCVAAVRKMPAPELVPVLADVLNDVHPQVRVAARKALLEWARLAELDAVVRREATRVLAGSNWRGLEQAAILLAVRDHKPAAGRLVQLLRFERPEGFVTAAWALRKLAVPAVLPDLAATVEWQWTRFKPTGDRTYFNMIDLQVALLAEALGEARYRPAEALLRRFIAKDLRIGQESRAAAIWALGLIHENQPDPTLVEALIDRIKDVAPAIPPEDERVRRMSVIALGRMKERSVEALLRGSYPGQLIENPYSNACGWALQQITGQRLPPPGTLPIRQLGWFLEPVY